MHYRFFIAQHMQLIFPCRAMKADLFLIVILGMFDRIRKSKTIFFGEILGRIQIFGKNVRSRYWPTNAWF